jgi:hypothetical protein
MDVLLNAPNPNREIKIIQEDKIKVDDLVKAAK